MTSMIKMNMMMSRIPLRKMVTSFIIFQVVFVLVQVLILGPCFVHAPENDVQARSDPRVGKGQAPSPNNDKEKSTKKENEQKGKYLPTWESLESRPIPAWFDEAKIGIFLHWGVYSVPSFVDVGTRGLSEWFWNYWQGDHGAQPAGVSVKKYMAKYYPPDFHYMDFAKQFRAEFFKPKEWAELFKEAGAKYVVLTSKHHDGFTLWQSKRSWKWNAVDVGPHRDLLGDLASAVRESGLKFGAYHSLYEWFNPLFKEDFNNNFTTQNFVKDKLMPELTELVMKYKPDVVWADGQWKAPSSYWNSTNFLAWLYNESPVKDTVVSNDRWGDETMCKIGGVISCLDRFNPGTLQPRKWEMCMTVDKESWGYRRNARVNDYYNMDELTEIVAKTVSCGGNILINVGPTADGVIPAVMEERLLQLGAWLKVNGEAIYGSKPWKTQNDTLTPEVWYTSKGGAVYAMVMNWPAGDVLNLASVAPTPQLKVSWLGYKGSVEWGKREGGGIQIKLPKLSMSEIPCQWAWTFKMEGL